MHFLAYIGGNAAIDLLVQLVVAGLIFYVCVWFLTWVGLADPFMKVAKVILGLVALIFLINLLSGLGGHRFLW